MKSIHWIIAVAIWVFMASCSGSSTEEKIPDVDIEIEDVDVDLDDEDILEEDADFGDDDEVVPTRPHSDDE